MTAKGNSLSRGERALGPEALQRDVGHFWGILALGRAAGALDPLPRLGQHHAGFLQAGAGMFHRGEVVLAFEVEQGIIALAHEEKLPNETDHQSFKTTAAGGNVGQVHGTLFWSRFFEQVVRRRQTVPVAGGQRNTASCWTCLGR